MIGSVGLTQYAVLALGLLVITSEFTSGTIRTTLQCTPSRGRVLLAKAAVTGTVTFVLGLLLGVVGAAVAGPVLGRWGTAPTGGTIGDVLAVAAYLALVSVLALGLGAALRSAVLALTVLVATLMIVPLSLQEPDIAVLNRIADAFPGSPGALPGRGHRPVPGARRVAAARRVGRRGATAGPRRVAPPGRVRRGNA